MKKRNPIYTAGSFLLAGALTLSMAACSGAQTQATAEARRRLPPLQHRLPQPHLPRKRPLPRRIPTHSP